MIGGDIHLNFCFYRSDLSEPIKYMPPRYTFRSQCTSVHFLADHLTRFIRKAAGFLAATFLMAAPSSAKWDYVSEEVRDESVPYETIPEIRPADRIGWSADGNNNDPDDWAATPVALAIFAAAGLHEQFVHFSYNNRLDKFHAVKMAESNESTLAGAKYFGFETEVFYNLWLTKENTKELPGHAAKGVYPEYDAAIENAIEQILASNGNSRFIWIQAGPFEFAYRVLQEAFHNRGATKENLQNTILVSHSGINEQADKWKERDTLSGEIRPSAGAGNCVADFGVGFFFTGMQGRDRFGGKDNRVAWEYVEWMKTSACPAYRWMHTRFVRMSEFFQGEHEKNKGRAGLDASDAGMAYTLVKGDYDGDLEKFSKLVRNYCPE